MSGFKIVIHDGPIGCEQFRFPRSRKRRILKKWAKRPENFRNVFLEAFIVNSDNNTVTCTSQMAAQLKHLTDGQ